MALLTMNDLKDTEGRKAAKRAAAVVEGGHSRASVAADTPARPTIAEAYRAAR